MNIILSFKYLFAVISNSKKSYLMVSIISSFSITYILDIIYASIEKEQTIVPLTALFVLIVIIFFFIFIDFLSGVLASRSENIKINSSRMGATIAKCFGIILYFVVSAMLLVVIADNYVVSVLVFVPLILTLLKEYISIGENLERIYGKKSYMFSLVDKMFDIIELKFLKKLEDKMEDLNEKQ